MHKIKINSKEIQPSQHDMQCMVNKILGPQDMGKVTVLKTGGNFSLEGPEDLKVLVMEGLKAQSL